MSANFEVRPMTIITRLSAVPTCHKYIFLSHAADATNSLEAERQTVVTQASCLRHCPMG